MEQNIEVQPARPKPSTTPVNIQRPEPSKGDNNYSPRSHIYVREVKGRVETFRRSLGFLLMAVFAVLPWLTWNGEQAILFNILDQRFRIFGMTL